MTPKAIAAYMRHLQAASVKARVANTTKEQRSARMRELARARWVKRKEYLQSTPKAP